MRAVLHACVLLIIAAILMASGCAHQVNLEIRDIQQPVMINHAVVPVGGRQVKPSDCGIRYEAFDDNYGIFVFSQGGGYEEHRKNQIRDSISNLLNDQPGGYISDCKLQATGYVWNCLIFWWHRAWIELDGDNVRFLPPAGGGLK
jgi:hypothetical protein